ncbi:two-component regulator propeller domain-containing protein [Candidatus Poribacteria bacterium]
MKKTTLTFVLLFLLIGVSANVSISQQWELYTTADGLIEGSILSIREDGKGYLWFITNVRGANVYDGADFQTLNLLPKNNFYFALPDRAGNVWFATDKGVSRYDGKEFHILAGSDELNSTRYILEDRDGDLWFGTDKGVVRYDGARFQTFDNTSGLAVRTILEDRNGDLWLGTDKGVSRYDGAKFSSDYISSATKTIFEDRAGNLWFGTKGGVYRKDARSPKIEGPLLEVDIVDSILEDQNGDMWFATDSRGAIKYDYQSGNSEEFTAEKNGLASNNIMSMLEDSHGILWFGTSRGISRYDRQGFTHFPKVKDTALGSVRAILEDSDENLWFGTQNGVCKYTIQNLKWFTEEDGLAENSIKRKAALVDSKGNLWFGTAGKGVSRYDGKGFHNFDQQDGLVNNRTLSMLQDSKGNIWIGTKKGVSRYDGVNFEPVTGPKAPVDTSVSKILEDNAKKYLWFVGDRVSRCDGVDFESWDSVRGSEIAIDGSGNVWVGGPFDGLYKYDGKSWKQYTTADGIGSDQINWIVGTRGGDVWFGLNGGIARHDGTDFRNFTIGNGLSVKVAREDDSGRLWLGTDQGVVRCDNPGQDMPGFSDPIAEDHGLISNNVRSILSDRDGNLWFGTNKGVSKYDGENFQNIRLNLVRGYIHIILEDNDGAMWFVTEHYGAVRYIPPAKKIHPRIHITQIEADETYSGVDSIRISSTAGRITFEYKGISFRGGTIRYTHELEGSDSMGSTTTNDTRADYGPLKPGHYQFRVRAIDMDLHKSDPPATVDIDIFQPFYLTWQFITAIVLGGMGFLGGGGYLTIQLNRQRRTAAQLRERLREQEEVDRLQKAKMRSLRQLVAGLTHEMNNPIGVITSSVDVFGRTIQRISSILTQEHSQESKEDKQLATLLTVLKNMSHTSLAASERMASIVSNLRTFVRLDEAEWQRADIHEGIGNAIALMELESSGKIKVTKNYGDLPGIQCSPSSLNQVFMSMLRNASEAIGEAGEIKVRTIVQDEHAMIEISDTGGGIAPEHLDRIFDPGFTTKSMGVGVGLGLSICHQIIVDEHKGHIGVSSEPGKGTTFTITLPLS